MNAINPIMKLDYPDPDIIRVDHTYYMVSTTMHFMPGCEILRSFDLVHWEHAAYVYDKLDSTSGQTLTGKENIYGKGMWAASLRYHNGIFYICFVANDTQKTYLFTSHSIEGPWKKHYIEGFYHDASLLFDEDKVYIAYGNKNIYITQLKPNLTGPLKGGLHRLVVSDSEQTSLGYEGTHFYKINGKYYLFFIHSLPNRWMRVEACLMSDSLEGEFTGGDILIDDMGYCGQGVAQGGIVDTPEGNYYSILFQDRGAVGRIPVLIPIKWKNNYPIFGEKSKIPDSFPINSTRPEYIYEPLVQSDSFRNYYGLNENAQKQQYGCYGLKSVWQFNHEPDMSFIQVDTKKGILWITTNKICKYLVQAKNILTQRMLYPCCAGEVTLDISQLKEGDYAGLCALQGKFGFIAVTKRQNKNYIVMKNILSENNQKENGLEAKEQECIEIEETIVRFRVEVNFTNMKDEAKFLFKNGKEWKQLGPVHKLHFGLDHFTGCRFGLFLYATKEIGGKAGFQNFVYK